MKGRLIGAAIFLWAARAQAAGPPPDEVQGTGGGQAPATTGQTNIENLDKFGTATTPDAPPDDVLEGDVSFGGLLSTGNARSLSITGGSHFRIRRKAHQFGAQVAGNYGRAAVDADAATQTTVGNVQGRVRYDYFLHPRVSLFAMVTARHDPFQGLLARVNLDPGVAFYILKDPTHRLWTEAGYDFQYDRLTEEARVELDGAGMATGWLLPKTRINHAVRLAGAYVNNINDKVSFNTGLEYLQSVQVAERWRINWDVGLTATLFNKLAIATTFTLRMDNDPPAAGVKKVDTVTAVSLIYRFF